MLYQIHEMQRALMTPLTQWAEAAAKMFTSPVSPLAHAPFAQRIAAGYELMYRLGKDYEKPEFGIKTVKVHDKDVGIYEVDTIKKPFCTLIHFKKDWQDKKSAA